MPIHVSSSSFKQTRWYEYLVRFFFGGAITAIAGLISHYYGPAVGGLFLAFPAIFPAAASLVESHEIQKKHQHGMHGSKRGRQAAALEARGTALGSLGLAGFAILMWQFGMEYHWAVILLLALAAWTAISVLAWKINKRLHAPRAVRHDPAERKEAA